MTRVQLFFDFDGTIVNSEVGIVHAIKHFIGQMKLHPLAEDDYRKFIGPPLIAGISRFYPDLSDQETQQAIRIFQTYYRRSGLFQLELYPGIITGLDALRAAGYQLHIASSKPETIMKRIVTHLDLDRYFTGKFGATMDERTRVTKTDVLKYALAQTGADPAYSLMIGDREADMIGGKANHVRTIGVTYGFGDRAELIRAKASLVIDRPGEILSAVQRLVH
ncbi:MAG: HAD hydrolase-like protein [Sporolactobacillus sp.]|jgi:phosphoglycolate phosphatase|nr:HAD hydrolase-like protein [Sporolactobacillus sp.]MCI1882569.1 HAD hydrolase-like protein [Sporolactobacillus sp.]